MKKVVEIAHDILKKVQLEGSAADFTLGGGNDCELLISLPNIKKVYAFDIQESAIEAAKTYLKNKQGVEKVMFISAGHEQAKQYIKEPIVMGIFNFGFYPKGDHAITTMVETSKQAVEAALDLLKAGGLLVLVLYPGHEQGRKESDYFDEWIQTLSSHQFDCASIHMSNKRECPYIQIIEKKR